MGRTNYITSVPFVPGVVFSLYGGGKYLLLTHFAEIIGMSIEKVVERVDEHIFNELPGATKPSRTKGYVRIGDLRYILTSRFGWDSYDSPIAAAMSQLINPVATPLLRRAQKRHNNGSRDGDSAYGDEDDGDYGDDDDDDEGAFIDVDADVQPPPPPPPPKKRVRDDTAPFNQSVRLLVEMRNDLKRHLDAAAEANAVIHRRIDAIVQHIEDTKEEAVRAFVKSDEFVKRARLHLPKNATN